MLLAKHWGEQAGSVGAPAGDIHRPTARGDFKNGLHSRRGGLASKQTKAIAGQLSFLHSTRAAMLR